MTRDPNPARVRTFDHSAVAELPEYQAASEALDSLVKAINEGDGKPATQDDWLELVRNMTAAIPFSDCCDGCNHDTPVIPAAVVGEGEGIQAGYICPRCNHRWTCWWATTAPNLG